MPTTPLQSVVLQFLRGDMPTLEFEQWVYSETQLEEVLDPEFYLYFISVNYRDPDAVLKLRGELNAWLLPTQACKCLEWTNECLDSDCRIVQKHVCFEHESLLRMSTIKERIGTNISLVGCDECGQRWLLASDEEHDFYLHLLDKGVSEGIDRDIWPDVFDGYRSEWIIMPIARMRKEPSWVMWSDYEDGREASNYLAHKFVVDGGLQSLLDRETIDDDRLILASQVIRSLVNEPSRLEPSPRSLGGCEYGPAIAKKFLVITLARQCALDQLVTVHALNAYLDKGAVWPASSKNGWADSHCEELRELCAKVKSLPIWEDGPRFQAEIQARILAIIRSSHPQYPLLEFQAWCDGISQVERFLGHEVYLELLGTGLDLLAPVDTIRKRIDQVIRERLGPDEYARVMADEAH